MRARAEIEEDKKGKQRLVVTEIPYQVNKAKLMEKIADLVRDKKIDGITDLRDESDRSGMRMVIELRRDIVPEVVLNNLYKMTYMQSSFGIIMLAIVNGQPQVMSLKEVLNYFIDFRRDVVTRRTIYELDQALARAHILEGLKIALDNLDAIIALIRASADPSSAREGLMAQFSLSERQAQAILDMRLQKLTGLERDKILAELAEIRTEIERLRAILADEDKMMALIKEELLEVREQFVDERRTEIIYDASEIGMEDLIAEETMVVTITHQGYVKRTPISVYRAQARGGKGRRGMATKDEDFVEDMFVASTHTPILVFSSIGKVYKLKVWELPQGGPYTRGKPFVQLMPFDEDEKVEAVLPIEDFEEGKYVVSATRGGIVKRTELIQYQNVHSGGIIALGLKEGDELVSVKLTEPGDCMFLASRTGQSIRFDQDDVRSMGRTAAGVYGMRFKDDVEDFVVSAEVIPHDYGDDLKILTITENGYGKRTDIDEHSVQGRGGMGVITIQTTDRNGDVVGCRIVGPNDELMLITDHGQIIRTRVSEISVYSRNTQGVRVMNTAEDERIVSIARIREEDLIEDEEEEGEEGSEASAAAEEGSDAIAQTEDGSGPSADDADDAAPIDDASSEEE
jgi:DNA gyrase subunit A